MVILVEKLYPKKYSQMQWHTLAVNIITNIEVKIDSTLPKLSTMDVVTWIFHVGDPLRVGTT